ncbi:hemophore-related protein [Mycobacterium lacus]|uniref:Uncharacterized protein n=1 Tax=Mycobacterium lacus TaxID=169765 RepID=A0A1X1Y3W6_9MYCO|nr:hemophore-related protein [Mycobacterium lacus]MCV7125369.1 hemophore-related protein [Mycobacterium lacus]ORW05710.1 hypothetical protein AWC15_01420 [Mycobacterium lacus]BBX99312.1 hypothetical protein MLAC_46060 [Mycobacterium lacus]
MKISRLAVQRRVAGIGAGCLLGGMAIAALGAPQAGATPDCGPEGVRATVSPATGSACAYLAAHPDANQAVGAAYNHPRPPVLISLRNYVTQHPQEYGDLRDILTPIGGTSPSS